MSRHAACRRAAVIVRNAADQIIEIRSGKRAVHSSQTYKDNVCADIAEHARLLCKATAERARQLCAEASR